MTARPALHTAGSGDGVPGPVGAAYARLAQTAVVAKNGITPRTGVVYAGVANLLVATGSMQVRVLPLHFIGSKADAQGTYWGANDGDFLLTLAAAPGAGSRTDKVYIMQQDSNPGTTSPDASTAPLIAATSGSLPAGAVQIGTVLIPAGTTALTDAGVVITTTCQWTAAAGAPIPVRSTAERAALSPYLGMLCLRLDKPGLVQTYDGSTWRGQRTFTTTLVSPSGSRDGSGVGTLAHGAPFTPVGVHMQELTIGRLTRVLSASFTSTTFQVQVLNSDDYTGNNSTQSWFCTFYEALT